MPSRLCEGCGQALQSFKRTVLKFELTSSNLDLTAGDGEGGARGEASNHWLRDEVDQEAKPEVAHDDDDQKHADVDDGFKTC